MRTCAFAGCILSKYLLLHLCFRIKYQSIRVKKEKKKVTTATTTQWLPIVRVSVIPLHSLDCLLSTYLLCMSVRWTAYCASIRYTCSLHSTGILIVRVCDIRVHSLDCIMFLLSICYTCVFAGLLTAQMFAIPVLRLDCLSVVRVYVLPVYSLDYLSVVRASVMPVHSQDRLLSEYLLYTCIHWIAYQSCVTKKSFIV